MAILINPYRFAAAAAGLHWQELGRTTLSGTSDTIDVTSLTAKPYMMVLGHTLNSGSTNIFSRNNGDSGSNYAENGSINGGTNYTQTSQAQLDLSGGGESKPMFVVQNIMNISDQEKLIINHTNNCATGAANAPNRIELAGKWANTSSSISSISFNNTSSGSYDTGSEVVVLGYDPADTEGGSVWEELADVDWTSGATLDSGTFTAKKYLYFEIYFDQASGSNDPWLQFNSDTGRNYAWRMSTNSATDVTYGSQSYGVNITGITVPRLYSGYIINKSDKEKLCILHSVRTAAGGAGTAPDREEAVFKWANTSAQITQIEINAQTGNLSTGNIKVWGFD